MSFSVPHRDSELCFPQLEKNSGQLVSVETECEAGFVPAPDLSVKDPTIKSMGSSEVVSSGAHPS